MLELEPFTWRTIRLEELDLTSLKTFISTVSSYLEIEMQMHSTSGTVQVSLDFNL